MQITSEITQELLTLNHYETDLMISDWCISYCIRYKFTASLSMISHKYPFAARPISRGRNSGRKWGEQGLRRREEEWQTQGGRGRYGFSLPASAIDNITPRRHRHHYRDRLAPDRNYVRSAKPPSPQSLLRPMSKARWTRKRHLRTRMAQYKWPNENLSR